jgi:cytoskeletal protein CcmA (bactofilin family)
VGDIKTARIVIEDGAFFKGSIDIARPEAPRTPATPQSKQQPAIAAASSTAVTPANAPATATAGER